MNDGNHSEKPQKSKSCMDESLTELLCFFGAASLGDGNVNAGANTLAAMALALANLAHPDSRAKGPNSQRVSLGCSFMASGALTPSLVSDYVVKTLAATQSNLNRAMAEHERVVGLRAKYIAEGDNLIMDPAEERKRVREKTLVEGFVLDSDNASLTRATIRALIECSEYDSEEHRRHELLSRHAYFVSGESPAVILKLLQNVHAGHPLVSFTLRDARSVSAFNDLVANVLDGYSHWNSMAKGNLIVLDPREIRNDSDTGGENKSSWMNRMLWLVDGPDLPKFDSCYDSKLPCTVAGSDAFRFAGLDRILTSRLLEGKTYRLPHVFGIAGKSAGELNLGSLQNAWCKRLLQIEGRFLGITSIARSLPSSLIAGFGAMGFESRSGFNGLVHAAYKLSMILTDRMIVAHERLCQSEKGNRQEELETRVIGSLSKKGPLKSYSIAKNLNGVRTEECNEVLTTLESRGLVRRGQDMFWYLAASKPTTRN